MLADEAEAVQEGLLACDATNRLPAVVEAFLSPDTPVKEKERLWHLMDRSGGPEILLYAERLLTVSEANGAPLNDLRYRIWSRLHYVTKRYYPLELDASIKEHFDQKVRAVAYGFQRELDDMDAGKWKYTDEQRRQMALDRANSIIKVWDGQKTEEKQ